MGGRRSHTGIQRVGGPAGRERFDEATWSAWCSGRINDAHRGGPVDLGEGDIGLGRAHVVSREM